MAVGAGLAWTLVAGVSAATLADDGSVARADLAALGLEVQHADTPGIAVPDVEDWDAVGDLDFGVELDKNDIWHLTDAQAAARAAEQRALAEQRAAAQNERASRTRTAAPQQSQQAQQSAPAESGGQAQPQVASAGQGGERGSLASMVNNLRGQNGLAALGRDGTLDSVAQNWAQWMASNQTLQHNPNYASQIGGGWSRSGENIVRNTGARSWSSGDITSWMFNWWANSSVHRANMLGSHYTHVGVGYAMGSGGPYAVLVFGGR